MSTADTNMKASQQKPEGAEQETFKNDAGCAVNSKGPVHNDVLDNLYQLKKNLKNSTMKME